MSDDRPRVQYIPPIDAPPWPIEARTTEDAFAMLRQPPRWMQIAAVPVVAIWGCALVVCWILAWIEIANDVAALGRAAGHRAYLAEKLHSR